MTCSTWLPYVVLLSVWASVASAAADTPRREDHGDLIVLHVYGSYRDMARQEARLLGPVLREVFDFNRTEYGSEIAKAKLGARLVDSVMLPLWSGLGRSYEDSGLHEYTAGLADVLEVAPREVLRASLTVDAASTVFAATGTATADQQALIGRNVDWGDAGGRRRPLVVHYHPNNGDLAYISVGWPLLIIPVVGLNEAGLAISMNYFETEPMFGAPLPEWPQRRVLQVARSVAEAVEVFDSLQPLGFAGFFVLADRQGQIAMLECRPSECARFQPSGDWFAQANHARTPEMIPNDHYRSPDSFARLSGVEAAVRRHLPNLTPALAAQILRDRTGYAFSNSTSVANLFVLNAVVVQPAEGLLWHSTTMQPLAPFGEYRAFSPVNDVAQMPPLAAATELVGGKFNDEAQAIAGARSALQAQRRGDYAQARILWENVVAEVPPLLDPARVALARAWNLYALADLAAAYEALAPTESESAPFDARAYGLVARALLADRLGHRDEAVRLYLATLAHLDAQPAFNVFDEVRSRARAGLEAHQGRAAPPIDWWLVGIPR